MASDISSGVHAQRDRPSGCGPDAPRRTGGGTLTVLSCDNLGGNGDRLRAGLEAFFDATGTGRAPLALVHSPTRWWTGSRPPRPGRDRRPDRRGRRPARHRPVLTEAFSEWVIEDTGRPLPDWTRGGVELRRRRRPYENRKLLMLNAAHSALPMAGFTAATVRARGRRRPGPQRHIRALWARRRRFCRSFDGAELEAIRVALVSRFAVAGMAHRLSADRHGRKRQAAATHTADPEASPVSGTGGGKGSRPTGGDLMTATCRAGEPLDDPMEAALQKADACRWGTRTMLRASAACLGVSKDDLPGGSQGCASTPVVITALQST
jgi:hypothetical protein